MFLLLSLPASVVVCHIAERVHGKDRWRLRCSSMKVRQMILDWVPRPLPFLTDFTGNHVKFHGYTRSYWMDMMKRFPEKYHSDRFHDHAVCIAVFKGPECRDLVNLPGYIDEIPFVRDNFTQVIAERIYFGYLDTLYAWFERCRVHINHDGFFDDTGASISWWDDARR